MFSKRRSRRSLLVPLIIIILALLPSPNSLPSLRQLFISVDNRIFDLMTHYAGFPIPDSKMIVIAKDQACIDLLGREPNRNDMAQLLFTLASCEAKIVALDFIYSESKTIEEDELLSNALRNFPISILAQRFTEKTVFGINFERIAIAKNADKKFPHLLPLYHKLANQATDYGIINIFPDLDGCVRFLPIGFAIEGKNSFQLSLAATTWAWSLLENITLPSSPTISVLNKDIISNELALFFEKAPYPLGTVGDELVDEALRRLEIRWVLNKLLSNIADNEDSTLRAEIHKLSEEIDIKTLPRKSWLKWPNSPLPLMGLKHAPSLRIPFGKNTFPILGDGVKTLSMAQFLQPKTKLTTGIIDISSNEELPEKLEFDWANFGTGTLFGKCVDFDENPISNAEVFCIAPETGFWATATTNSFGEFVLDRLPPGTFSVEIAKTVGSTTQILKLENPVYCSETTIQLPKAIFLPQSIELTFNLNVASVTRKLIISGDGIWLAKSGKNGELPLKNVPTGFVPSDIAGEKQFVISSDTMQLLDDSGVPLPDNVVALVETEPQWNRKISSEILIPPGVTQVTASYLPPGLGVSCTIAIPASENGKVHSCDFDILLNTPNQIASEIPQTLVNLKPVTVKFKLEPNITLHIRTSARNWINPQGEVTLPTGKTLILAENKNGRGTFNRLKSIVKDKIIFIGTTLIEDHDFFSTPINYLETEFTHVPGINLHAYLFSSLSNERFLRATVFHHDKTSWAWVLTLLPILLIIWLVIDEIFFHFGAFAGGVATIFFSTAWILIVQKMFSYYLLLPCFLPVLSFISLGSTRAFQSYSEEREREQKARLTFGRFVSSQVVEEILKDPDSIKPGGQKRELTVMFTDLAGFTSISETLDADALVKLMNEYLGEMTAVLFEFGGTLDKYIGDAIMAFWNFPRTQKDHAERCCRCILEMQDRLTILREKWRKLGYPPVFMRAGINTAECVVGFIGGETQMNFTCMGDGVNLASRMEGANKVFSTYIMISETTKEKIAGTDLRTRFLDFLAVKGKAVPMKVFELIGKKGTNDELWEKVLPIYDEGISLYLKRQWQNAIAKFEQVLTYYPEDGPSKTYIDRCREFQLNPPPENWDGRYSLKTK